MIFYDFGTLKSVHATSQRQRAAANNQHFRHSAPHPISAANVTDDLSFSCLPAHAVTVSACCAAAAAARSSSDVKMSIPTGNRQRESVCALGISDQVS